MTDPSQLPAQVMEEGPSRPAAPGGAKCAGLASGAAALPAAVGHNLLRQLQALEDAIVLRRARAGAYCCDCDESPGGRCDDHACDLRLIAGYEQDARALSATIQLGPRPVGGG